MITIICVVNKLVLLEQLSMELRVLAIFTMHAALS